MLGGFSLNIAVLKRQYHTIRFLKREQVLYRVFYLLRELKRHELSIPPARLEARVSFRENISQGVITEDEATFLGYTIKLSEAEIWNNPNYAKLFLYNLHYFDVLNTKSSDARPVFLKQLISRWIDENPCFEGNGWEPYPLSLRMTNWVKYFLKYPDIVEPSWLESLAIQAQALMKQLEFHILGNHLFANAKALVFVGTYFKGEHAEKWFKKGLKLLDREVAEQFLLDGGHFERSPMYHAALLWDMCDLYYLSEHTQLPKLAERQKQWGEVILRGVAWLDAMSHPDGEISFFNDATFGIAPTLLDIKAYVEWLGLGSTSELTSLQYLKNTGYCVLSPNAETKLIVDVGDVGPDYQPGHAHADTLSFELSLFGRRVVVNSGISQYGQDATRHAQRSTTAHNTVCINQANSSDVWAGFRVGQRAKPFDLELSQEKYFVQVGCSHDGYKRQPGKNIHRRIWTLSEDKLYIKDIIKGEYKSAEAYFYLHPDVRVVSQSSDSIHLSLSNQKDVVFYLKSGGQWFVRKTSWFPAFGKAVPNHCIVVQFSGAELLTEIVW